MDRTNCDCQISCTGGAVIASIVIGILAGIFRFTALVTITPAFLWVLFGIAIGYLGITLLTSSVYDRETNNCCRNLTAFLVGVLGTVLTSVILLGITFVATSVIGAIITGLLLFFFSLMLITAACLIRCRYNCR